MLATRPTPPPAAPGRSATQLRDQHAALVLALRAGLSDEDAASLMPHASLVALPARGARRTDARFTAAVIAVLDALPKHLLVNLPRALQHLPLQQRLALLLVIVRQHPKAPAAAALGCSVRTLDARLDAALTHLARL